MTDHTTPDEQLLLASAYMDGELDAAEQARAEDDPAVMSLVAELRDVRRQLAVGPLRDTRRQDAVIAAALSAAPPIPSAVARRRMRWMAPLAAAAAVVLVVGGIVALRAGDNGDDGDIAGSAQTELETQSDAAAGTAAPALEEATEETQAAAAPAEAAVTTAAGAESGDEATDGTEAEATRVEGITVLVTEDDLRAYVAEAGVGTAELVEPPCRTDARFLGLAEAQPVGTTVTVEVYAVEAPPELLALDHETCEVVLRATP